MSYISIFSRSNLSYPVVGEVHVTFRRFVFGERFMTSILPRTDPGGAIVPPETYESNFIHHDFCRIWKTALAI